MQAGPSQPLALQNPSTPGAARAAFDCERDPWVLLRTAPEPTKRRRAEEPLADGAGISATRRWPRQPRLPQAAESRSWGGAASSLEQRLASAEAASRWVTLPLALRRECRALAREERPAERASPPWTAQEPRL